jgi:WD40 repeat protein
LKRKVVDATFSRDGKLLAFSDARSDIFLWDMTHGASVRELLNAAVWSLAFSLEYRVPPDEAGLRTSLAFNPDGKILALGNGNGTVWLWDTGANQLVGKPLSGHLRRVNGVAFSPDGRKMLTSDEGGTVLLWDVEPAAWVERACDIANRSLTPEEWRQYARGEPYRRLCAGRPRLTPRGLSAARR